MLCLDAQQEEQWEAQSQTDLKKHIDILHPSLAAHPLDLVMSLREMTLYSDSAPFR